MLEASFEAVGALLEALLSLLGALSDLRDLVLELLHAALLPDQLPLDALDLGALAIAEFALALDLRALLHRPLLLLDELAMQRLQLRVAVGDVALKTAHAVGDRASLGELSYELVAVGIAAGECLCVLVLRGRPGVGKLAPDRFGFDVGQLASLLLAQALLFGGGSVLLGLLHPGDRGRAVGDGDGDLLVGFLPDGRPLPGPERPAAPRA